MIIACEKCGTSYEISDVHGGRMAKCQECRHRFILPIHNEQQLLDWASSCKWHRLFRFMTRGGARGHAETVVEKLIRIFEIRRWAEEDRVRAEMLVKEKRRNKAVESDRLAREKRRIRREMQQHRRLDSLRSLTPTEFEVLVADIYKANGYEAFAVGGGSDNGIDVEIYTSDGNTKWAIVQCKRYSEGNTVGSGAIRNFAGSWSLAEVKLGFFVTTSSYTRQAIKTASRFNWLTLYDGPELVKLIQKAEEKSLENLL